MGSDSLEVRNPPTTYGDHLSFDMVATVRIHLPVLPAACFSPDIDGAPAEQ